MTVAEQTDRRDMGARGTAAAVVVAGLAAVGVATAVSPAALSDGPVLCPFRHVTGLPCPGCGLTRSWVALGHGDIASSFGFNAFGPVFAAIAVVATGLAIWTLIAGRPALDRLRTALTGRFALGVIAVWLGYGTVRAVFAACGWGFFPSVT
ncbi:DUF2752 domain-containing protein [Gordonia rhizosphera]|uniref:DUF2752 domain-containing protein n=1 Tax=Gordonia rhizosphera TaxID=83341 RepID=UPI00058E47EB|nr:DUF2752 domain-containing protein [Gordonia rhizosphera]